MGFLKKYPIFTSVVVLLLLVAGAAGYLAITEKSKVVEAKQDYLDELRKLEEVSRGVFYEGDREQRVAPTAENREKLEQRLSLVTSDLQRIRQGMAARSGNLLSDTADDFTFLPKLQSFIASLKAMAASNNVKLEAEEAFGFAKYATEAEQPPTEMISALNLQRQVLDYILQKLIESEPSAILAVEREFVEEVPDENDRRRRTSRDANDDVFTIEELVTARTNEFIDTSAFRVVFTGRTDVLRRFLNRIGTFELPLIVRNIEVQPAMESDEPEEEEQEADSPNALFALFGGDSSEEDAAESEPQEIPGREPVITENKSKFSVVIEYVEVTIGSDESEGGVQL